MIEAAAMKKVPEFAEASFNLMARSYIEESNVVPLIRWFKHHSLSYNQIGTLICMSRGKLETLRSVAQWLTSIHVKPELMVCSIEERWRPMIKYFYYLGIDREGLKRMLIIKPMIFCVDLEATIVPKPLQENLSSGGFHADKFWCKTEKPAKVISLAPELLGCSISRNLENNVKYFLSLGIRLIQLGDMIADFPMLLRYNVDHLRPKFRYLRKIMVRPLEDLIEFPRFFSYSLEGRIAPRHKVMVKNRVNFKLRYMLTWSDEEFMQRVEDAVERRLRFEAGLISVFSEGKTEVGDEIKGDRFVDPEMDEDVEDVYTDSESDDGETEDEDEEGGYLESNVSVSSA